MSNEQALGSWLTEQFAGTREERAFSFATMITDAEEAQTPAEREQRAIAYAYDRARSLCEQAIANGGMHESYMAEAEQQFRVVRAALMAQMGPQV
jgi:hypothetical protein